MKYPISTRTNMRYRGPVESVKMNHNYVELRQDIADLFNRLNAIQSGISVLDEKLYHGEEGITSTSSMLQRIDKRIELLKRGAKNV